MPTHQGGDKCEHKVSTEASGSDKCQTEGAGLGVRVGVGDIN